MIFRIISALGASSKHVLIFFCGSFSFFILWPSLSISQLLYAGGMPKAADGRAACKIHPKFQIIGIIGFSGVRPMGRKIRE